MSRATRYPRHLAKHVAERLARGDGRCPPESVLRSLFETLYFASLKTDENRPCRFTVNYIEPQDKTPEGFHDGAADLWSCVPFQEPLKFDVRTLAKLADAVDPSVSSLAVFSDDDDRLSVWGLVDQELRYADYAALDSATIPRRPGLFQATINGVGNISVYDNYSLIGSLEQNLLVRQYYDVIWCGPIHDILKHQLRSTCCRFAGTALSGQLSEHPESESELLRRWLNAICRILLNIQQYRHGGGLLIAPHSSPAGVNVKYGLHYLNFRSFPSVKSQAFSGCLELEPPRRFDPTCTNSARSPQIPIVPGFRSSHFLRKFSYDRLPKALAGLVRHQVSKDRVQREIAEQCRDRFQTDLPRRLHEDILTARKQLEAHKNEVLGCVRFIASLSRVDGFVILDKSLVVHGFGVELRADSALNEVWIAGDSRAHARWMRTTRLEEFGTRHRAMMRYCFETPGTLGFVISQDGDVRAVTRIRDKLLLWENVNVQLAFRAEGQLAAIPLAPIIVKPPLNDVA